MDIKEAVIQVKAFARTFKAVTDLASILEEMGSIEQAQAESIKKLDEIKKAREEAELALACVLEKVDSESKKETQMLHEAEQKAAVIESEAQKVLSAAQAEASSIIEASRKTANKVLSDAALAKKKTLEEAKTQAHQIISSVDSARKELESLSGAIDAKTAEHNDITNTIEGAKAALRAFVGEQ